MAHPDSKSRRKVDYRNLCEILLAELDRVMDSQDYDIHKAFVWETAHVFSSVGPGFSLTDGPNEWGIDFCRSDSPVFTIAQCKCPERSFLVNADKPKRYDRDALEDLLTAINFMFDTDNAFPNAPLALKQFKTSYHDYLREWPKETRLQAGLAVCGELTPQASNYFRQQKNKLSEQGVELLLWDWEKFEALLTTPQIDIGNMSVTFTIDDPDKELLKRRSPLCLVKAAELVEAWDEYQWQLLDWNVRAEIRNSPTNKRIQDTLHGPAGRRRFHDYNNGLLVVCANVKYRTLPGRKISITLLQPQVVNGCQTLLSLVRAYLDLPEKDKQDFRDKVRVELKIVQRQDPQFVERIIRSTNDQNPMSPRSLKSNAVEQKQLQERFGKAFIPYFYERKEGQFDGFRSFDKKIHWFRPRDYEIRPRGKGKPKYRTLDNSRLAREWLAFVGFSDRTLMGGLHLFENDELYAKAFLFAPTDKFWENLVKAPTNAPPVNNDDYFTGGSASVSQFLLAHTIWNFVHKQRISSQKNKAAAIERLARKGAIRVDASGKPIDDAITVDAKLNKDEKYYLGTVINNMEDVIVELYAMVLCMRYEQLDAKTCEDLLKYPPIRAHLENPSADVSEDAKIWDNKHILALIYEFIRFTLEQYIIRYGDAMRAQPRLKSYLSQRSTVDKLRDFLLEVDNEKVPGWAASWCAAGRPFISELPTIT